MAPRMTLRVPRVVRVRVWANCHGALVTIRPFGRETGRFAAFGVQMPRVSARLHTGSASFDPRGGGRVP